MNVIFFIIQNPNENFNAPLNIFRSYTCELIKELYFHYDFAYFYVFLFYFIMVVLLNFFSTYLKLLIKCIVLEFKLVTME
jgi:hypothetical protein